MSKQKTIHEAAKSGDLENVKALLTKSPDLVFDKQNQYAWTPLHWASRGGHKDVAGLLLANGAKVDATDGSKRTPLQYATGFGFKDVVELLLANQADVQTKDQNGLTPLHSAAGSGRKEIVELLLANKAEINCEAKDGQTPLDCAAINGRRDIVRLLQQNNGSPSAKKGLLTPLTTAVILGGLIGIIFVHGPDLISLQFSALLIIGLLIPCIQCLHSMYSELRRRMVLNSLEVRIQDSESHQLMEVDTTSSNNQQTKDNEINVEKVSQTSNWNNPQVFGLVGVVIGSLVGAAFDSKNAIGICAIIGGCLGYVVWMVIRQTK